MCYDHIVSSLSADRVAELFKRAPSDANTPAKLAKLTGVPIETIKVMQKGNYEPTLHFAYKLAAAFEVPLENLFVGGTATMVSIKSPVREK